MLSPPRRVQVSKILRSRYDNHTRPLSWDERRAGLDVVRCTDGEELSLWSDGGQSPPQEGWVILLTAGEVDSGVPWTLYSIP